MTIKELKDAIKVKAAPNNRTRLSINSVITFSKVYQNTVCSPEAMLNDFIVSYLEKINQKILTVK